jgi:hypothetical protein
LSLTRLLLDHPEIKGLFSTIPNMKHLTGTLNEDGIAFSKDNPIVVKSNGRANPIIGHAYDYWLRAYVQRLNGIHIEKEYEDLIASWSVDHLCSKVKSLKDTYAEIIWRRRAYIIGSYDIDIRLIKDCMVLGNLDAYYRSGYVSEQGVLYMSDKDMTDLLALTRAIKKYNSFFSVSNTLICNPAFGDITRVVGGADADLIIDDTLIDIKTESTFGYKAGHIRQLIGYYILACLTPSFTPEIKKLAIWNPRYCRYIYLTIADICRSINLLEFVDQFIRILFHPEFYRNKAFSGSIINKIHEEVLGLWKSCEQQLRRYYE